VHGGADGVLWAAEHDREPVAAGGEEVAGPLLEHGPEDLVVTGECGVHVGEMVLPQTGRALDVREQKGHRCGRRLGHAHRLASTMPLAPHSAYDAVDL